MEKIEISVIIPIYNPYIEYLKIAIKSILSQNLKNIELILILDGSNEKIENFCNKYQEKNHQIKIFKQENKGEGGARNTGIKKANGKWIIFVDPDDWVSLNSIEIMKKTINKYKGKDVDIIIFDTYINYRNKQIENKFYNKDGVLQEKDKEEIKLQNIEKGLTKYYPKNCNVSVVWAKLYKKQFIQNNKLEFKEKIKRMPDTIFNIEAFEQAKNIVHCSEYIYHYRKNENSITHNYYVTMLKDINIFLEEVKKYIEKYKKDERYVQTYYIAVLTKLINYIEIAEKNNEIVKWKEIIKNIENFKEKYKEELRKIPTKNVGTYQKLMLNAILKNKWKKIKKYLKIKTLIKGHK